MYDKEGINRNGKRQLIIKNQSKSGGKSTKSNLRLRDRSSNKRDNKK